MENSAYTPQLRKDLTAFVAVLVANIEGKKIIAEGLEEAKKNILAEGGTMQDVMEYYTQEMPNDPDFKECTNLLFQSQQWVADLAEIVIPQMKFN
jgi:hypothetical protein